MTLAERTLNMQKENLKNANGARFTKHGYEYKLSYEGGIAEAVNIYGRRVGERNFKLVSGFNAYMCNTTDEVIKQSMALVG